MTVGLLILVFAGEGTSENKEVQNLSEDPRRLTKGIGIVYLLRYSERKGKK